MKKIYVFITTSHDGKTLCCFGNNQNTIIGGYENPSKAGEMLVYKTEANDLKDLNISFTLQADIYYGETTEKRVGSKLVQCRVLTDQEQRNFFESIANQLNDSKKTS